jgi:hypothetical protein
MLDGTPVDAGLARAALVEADGVEEEGLAAPLTRWIE